jgi:hypothetical protein
MEFTSPLDRLSYSLRTLPSVTQNIGIIHWNLTQDGFAEGDPASQSLPIFLSVGGRVDVLPITSRYSKCA